jgi:hypothetical protein
MANDVVGIKLDGKEYFIKFGFKGVLAFERALEIPILKAVEDTDNFGIETILNLTWAGLKTLQEDLSIDDVETLLEKYFEDGGKIEDLTNKVLKAFSESEFFKNQKK